MVQPESTEIQAPKGTYQRLANIEGGRLGNAYTKRFLTINDVPSEITGAPWISVRLRVEENRSSHTYRSYSFALTEEDVVVDIRAVRYKIEKDAPVEPITPPLLQRL